MQDGTSKLKQECVIARLSYYKISRVWDCKITIFRVVLQYCKIKMQDCNNVRLP